MLYEIGDFIDTDDDRLLINGYRYYMERYHSKIQEVFEWLAALPKFKLLKLKLFHQPRNSRFYESIIISTKDYISSDVSILIFKNNDYQPHMYKTLKMLGRADY